ncbi:MAG: hypothetical protein AB1671_16685 [Thermodesulfobacteriota bacterium]|jgi:hypothetical protein
MWFHFLIAHWQVLPEEIRQKVKAYDLLRKASQLRAHSPAALNEAKAIEQELKRIARHYGWGG